MTRIGWSIAHQEFTIFDYYYFSKLYQELVQRGAKIVELSEISNKIRDYDVLVFNYPEKPFTSYEIKLLREYMVRGGRVIVLGYYQNEDSIAHSVNSLTLKFGIELLDDVVIDKENSIDEEGLMIVTSKVLKYNKNVKKVLLPCSASLILRDSDAYRIVMGEETAVSSKTNETPILFAGKKVGAGELIVGGTCVFWDNFSIMKYDNLAFALNLLL